ncbi:serine/threonine protein kinase [Lysinibacillus sp. NPDC097287]|uniref:serine/threonine protein kinase n=1 Tax=Lysinibacillus sp. NPDC097287 TaxID=3364144 RepID=UPI003830E61C
MWWRKSREAKFDNEVQRYITKHSDFIFIKFLGYGSYGRTYLVEDVSSHKHYVLKCLRPKHRRSNKTKHKFMQEIQILEQLTLPFVPSIKMTGILLDMPYFVMDYVDGQTFEQLIFDDGQKFKITEALSITQQLLTQVISLHNKGIVHRDLRIPNILLVEGNLHIIDLGLATYMKEVDFATIRNPKRAENHISDLYFVGHFLLFLLYSTYEPTSRKEKSWQEELSLPAEVVSYLERLLCINEPFQSAAEALQSLPIKK